MKKCPSCQRESPDDALGCAACGLIFAKWEAPQKASTPGPQENSQILKPAPPFPWKWAAPALVVLAAAGFWKFRPVAPPPRVESPAPAPSGNAAVNVSGAKPCFSDMVGGEWDLGVPFPGQPMGLAWTGAEFLSCNRVDPWGMVRLSCTGEMKIIPVQEPLYQQKISLNAIAWNGKQAVANTDGAWFQAQGRFFVTLQPGSLRIGEKFPAPPLTDSLAWDGEFYWTATRRNTVDSTEEAFLYKLDGAFNIVEKWPAPFYGCQGLAWAGPLLFWADVFENKILILKMDGGQPAVIHKFDTEQKYLSGIAWDGQGLWLVNYGEHRLQRLPPRLIRAWLGGDFRVGQYEMVKVARQVEDYVGGNAAVMDVLVAPLKAGKLDEAAISAMSDGLVSLGLRDEAQRTLHDMMERPEAEPYRAILQAQLDRFPSLSPPVQGP